MTTTAVAIIGLRVKRGSLTVFRDFDIEIERRDGTLERLMTTPLGRAECVVGAIVFASLTLRRRTPWSAHRSPRRP